MSVSIIAWLAYDINEGGENTAQNLGSFQKVIPRRNIIIETISKSHYHIDTFHWVTKRFGGQERAYSSRSGVDLHNRISLLFGSFTLFFLHSSPNEIAPRRFLLEMLYKRSRKRSLKFCLSWKQFTNNWLLLKCCADFSSLPRLQRREIYRQMELM